MCSEELTKPEIATGLRLCSLCQITHIVNATVWFRTLPGYGENADPAGNPAALIAHVPDPQ